MVTSFHHFSYHLYNDFQKSVCSKFLGISLQSTVLGNIDRDLQNILKLFVLLLVDATLDLSETEVNMQNAIDATLHYCKQINICIDISQTNTVIFSHGKNRKKIH